MDRLRSERGLCRGWGNNPWGGGPRKCRDEVQPWWLGWKQVDLAALLLVSWAMSQGVGRQQGTSYSLLAPSSAAKEWWLLLTMAGALAGYPLAQLPPRAPPHLPTGPNPNPPPHRSRSAGDGQAGDSSHSSATLLDFSPLALKFCFSPAAALGQWGKHQNFKASVEKWQGEGVFLTEEAGRGV